MASFYFNDADLKITKKTDTSVTSVNDGKIVLDAFPSPISLDETTIKNLGLKKDSKVTVEPIGNGFLLSATPAKKAGAPATKGSSPAGSLSLSNDDI